MLTDVQKSSFDRDGYVVVPEMLSEDHVTALRHASVDWLKPRKMEGGDAFVVREEIDGALSTTFAMYLEYRDPGSMLPLLALPALAALRASLAGPDPIPLASCLQVSRSTHQAPALWRQDALRDPCLRGGTLLIPLDPCESEGLLEVLPGSHGEVRDMCEIADNDGWSGARSALLCPSPGDVIFVDSLLVNRDLPTARPMRRVITWGFWSEASLDSAVWSDEWKESRRDLMSLAGDWPAQRMPGEERVHRLRRIAGLVAPSPAANICSR